MRGDLIVYLEQPQLGRRQPCKCVVYVAGENLPRRPIVQFDEVAFGMLHDFHAMACRAYNKKTVLFAKSSDPRTALKCRSTRNAAVQPRRGRIVGEHARHRRQVTNVPVDHPKDRDDRSLVRGDRIEIMPMSA
jgi:hypothetical protein